MVTRTRVRPDIVIQDRDGQPIAIVEIKNLSDLSEQVALEMLNNLRIYDLLENIPFALVLSQEQGFIWKDLEPETGPVQPTASFSMKEVVQRHLPNLVNGDRVYKTTLELLVLGWLIGLTAIGDNIQSEPETTLKETGFIDAIEDAIVSTQPSL